MGTWQFYLLFLLLFLNVSAGIMIISQASPMAQQLAGMTVLQAAGMVGVISLCNGLGRVFWAWVSDSLGRARVYFLLYLIQVAIFFALPHIRNVTLFTAAFCVIGLCYGGGSLATMFSFTADFFGSKSMGGDFLRLDFACLGNGRNSLSDHDRPSPAKHGQLRSGHYGHRDRDAGIAGPPADSAPPVEGTSRRSRSSRRGALGSTGTLPVRFCISHT